MEESKNQKAANSEPVDINIVFERYINLHKFLSNKPVIELLRITAEQYFTDRAAGKNVPLCSILIVGQINSGRRTLARAIANSFCLEFKETLGMTLLNGGDDVDYFLQGKDVAYFIREADCLTPGPQSEIYRLLTERQVRIFDPIEHKDKLHHFAGMLIMSVSDIRLLNTSIVNSFDIVCHLKGFTRDERYQIVKQRVDLLQWHCSDDVMLSLASIVNVWIMVRAAMTAYRVMRAKCEDVMTDAHVRKAICLLAAG